MERLSKYLGASAAAAGGAALLVQWLAATAVPKKGWEGRLALLHEWLAEWFPLTHTFEQLIRDFDFEEIRADGTIVGTISASGALLSKAGRLHEAGLMLLIDGLSSITVMAAGRLTGVSMDMGATVLAPVEASTRLRVESRALRIGGTTAFLSVDVRHATGSGELVATGHHTKHVGMPLLVRCFHGLALRLPALARRWTLKSLLSLAAVQREHSIQKLAGQSMEEALGLQLRSDDNSAAERFTAPIAIHLVNGYWSCHGAASAGLVAEAVRRHLAQKGLSSVTLAELGVSYLEPVPAFSPVAIDVTPLPRPWQMLATPEADWNTAGTDTTVGLRSFLVEIRSERGKLLVRGRVSALAS